MDFLTLQDKYPGLYFFWLEELGLYYAAGEENKTYLIERNGNIVYQTAEKTFADLNGSHFPYNWDKWETDFNRQIDYWTEIQFSGEFITNSIFSFRNGNLVRLLEDELILYAAPITPQRLLLQVAKDKDNPLSRVTIHLYDTLRNELRELWEGPYREEPFSVHRVRGAEHFFSIWIRDDENPIDHYTRKVFQLYTAEGEPLVDFETAWGHGGGDTCFDLSQRGMGITHRILDKPIFISSHWYFNRYEACDVLIDRKGNNYGDFYYIAGQKPSYFGKSSTRHPKYIDKKILCLALPVRDHQPPCLTILNEDGSRIVTEFECPWLFFNLSATLVKDKSIFGKTCLVVIDKECHARLIGLDGKEIENTTPIPLKSIDPRMNYPKLFAKQCPQ
ncbi:hypothetical protein NB696_000275 [Xanthomonas sacchari]|uniref:hypothetical protein n=1 Tax=Xanthomonas sacchari TaxID=56458 RepID=UPI00225C2E2E|nr:hypothetical protein [Xanthomonas sacchari]MCW0394533.1 hypothetical protein [Xanthomonas sacchari]MCW0443403.1 hypothetical protein [Xanthomonas sacchari]